MTTYKISPNPDFRRSVAEAILTEKWFSGTRYYADLLNSEVRVYEGEDRPKFLDESVYVRVGDLAPGARDVTEEVSNWEEALSNKQYTFAQIKEDYGKEESDVDEIIDWAGEQSAYYSIIEQCLLEAQEDAINFILKEFLDDIEI